MQPINAEKSICLSASIRPRSVNLGVFRSHIGACLAGRLNTTGGYRFRKVPVADIVGEEWKDISDDILEVARVLGN